MGVSPMSSVCFVTYVPGPDLIFLLTTYRRRIEKDCGRHLEHVLERAVALYAIANDAGNLRRCRVRQSSNRDAASEGKNVRVIDEV